MIPILNAYRAYIYLDSISLYLKNNSSIAVANDGWEILKYCDGTKNVDEIFDIINKDYSMSRANAC